ncbi:alpha/beta fold hydrolase [Celeribacter sp.]|uniref:alpha/beta fold hydrolase n=1 Tax=Celeribacter sp. TaxID=1890673 RepID=UPI003A90C13D
MSDPVFLFVHGSCHGAWCWRGVLPAMRARGVEARALDLPSHGDDSTPYAEVTLAHYRNAILADIDAHGGAPVVLVGHSAGGYPISAVADTAPEKVTHLAYVCAYVPRDGLSLADMRRRAKRQLILDAIKKTDDGLAFTFLPDKVEDALYGDCPHVLDFALPRLTPQAIAPQEQPLPLGPSYASVPRSYVICDEDRVIPPEYQAAMTHDWPAGSVRHLPSSHSPFFSMPERLADLLIAGAT